MTGPLRNKHTVSQARMIVEYLHTHRYITAEDAGRKLGILSLQRRLYDLREMGYVFGDETVFSEDRTVHWKRYWLVSEPMAKKEA